VDGKKILIVEDEPRIALALCRALELPVSGTPQVDISPVAETALAKLQSESFDLVITDLRMPGMGGVELMRYVRDASPHTKLLLITAFGSPDVEDVARRLGAAYLPKPFSLREFVYTVEGILRSIPREVGQVEAG
jgi:DNA-binding response OmpR family regulator